MTNHIRGVANGVLYLMLQSKVNILLRSGETRSGTILLYDKDPLTPEYLIVEEGHPSFEEINWYKGTFDDGISRFTSAGTMGEARQWFEDNHPDHELVLLEKKDD